MLQIATGKLFARSAEYTNSLRGVLHTNLFLNTDAPIETVAGRLLATSPMGDMPALVFEMYERIEATENGESGALVSHTVVPYLLDFGALVSFKLNVICAPDRDLVVRLTSGKRSLAGPAPNTLVSRCFDERVFCTIEEATALVRFVQAVIALERKNFIAVMRAIRTYVTGLHRMGDDLNLAYTMMVASLESLAQEFDGHQARWEDYDDAKRRRIDRALEDAEATIVGKVQAAILRNEHLKLARRFRAFAQDHIAASFFREEAPNAPFAISRSELGPALKYSYDLRSAYIHRLAEIPPQLTLPGASHELAWVNDKSVPTFAGLMRIVRHVIEQFIARAPKCEKEIYDYSLERAGIVLLPMAEQYWIHNVPSLSLKNAGERFVAFLSQVAAFLIDRSSTVTDIRAVLERALELMKTADAEQRRPLTALYALFNQLAPLDGKMPDWRDTISQYASDLSAPSVEAAIVHLFNGLPDWPLDRHLEVLQAHKLARSSNKGLFIPKLLDAALWLALAEQQRASGDKAAARLSIATAVEAYPGEARLRALEADFDDGRAIDWRNALTTPMSGASNE